MSSGLVTCLVLVVRCRLTVPPAHVQDADAALLGGPIVEILHEGTPGQLDQFGAYLVLGIALQDVRHPQDADGPPPLELGQHARAGQRDVNDAVLDLLDHVLLAAQLVRGKDVHGDGAARPFLHQLRELEASLVIGHVHDARVAQLDLHLGEARGSPAACPRVSPKTMRPATARTRMPLPPLPRIPSDSLFIFLLLFRMILFLHN